MYHAIDDNLIRTVVTACGLGGGDAEWYTVQGGTFVVNCMQDVAKQRRFTSFDSSVCQL